MQRNIVPATFDWLTANADQLAIGALVATGIIGLMLVMREVGHRLVAGIPTAAAGAA